MFVKYLLHVANGNTPTAAYVNTQQGYCQGWIFQMKSSVLITINYAYTKMIVVLISYCKLPILGSSLETVSCC